MIERIAVWLVTSCLMMAGTADAASNVVRIIYDAAGNIVAIERVNAAPIAPAGANSATGTAGAIVPIKGTVAPSGEPTQFDAPDKPIARVDASNGVALAATSQFVW